MQPENPMGHAPTPPPPASCAKNTISVLAAQITHENTCGTVSATRIERMYSANSATVTRNAIALKISLISMSASLTTHCEAQPEQHEQSAGSLRHYSPAARMTQEERAQ